MKTYRELFLLLCLLLSLDFCCLTGHSQSLLWKIDENNLPAPSYLYGTIHVKDKRAFEFNDSVMAAFERCDVTALEVDLSSANIVELSQRMIIPDGGTLEDIFWPDEYKIIKSVVEETTGMDMSLFNTLKPIAVLSMVLNFQLAQDMDVSVDEYFYRKAGEMDKRVVGIETIDEQLDILDNIPNDFIIDFFMNIDNVKEDLEQIITLYRSAELEKLLKLMMEDKSMVMLQKDLVISRNIKMADRISKLVQEQSAFIAVGAGHLPGKKGIIRLLIKKGYSVEPVGIPVATY